MRTTGWLALAVGALAAGCGVGATEPTTAQGKAQALSADGGAVCRLLVLDGAVREDCEADPPGGAVAADPPAGTVAVDPLAPDRKIDPPDPDRPVFIDPPDPDRPVLMDPPDPDRPVFIDPPEPDKG